MRHCKATARVAAAMLFCWGAAGAGAAPDAQTGFPVDLDGWRVRLGSVNLADLDGDGLPEIVVGTVDGKVHAYDGDGSKLWTYDTGELPIDAKVAIGDVDADGDPEVVVGTGSDFNKDGHGGLYVLSHTGDFVCKFQPADTGPIDGYDDRVFSSPALADLVAGDGGELEIAFGSYDRRVLVIEHDCSQIVWEKDVYDPVRSSPAIGDVDGDGQLDVVIGVEADANSPDDADDGGLLYVYDGATGDVLLRLQIDEVIWSSPALGDITGDGQLEIVVGTGYCWADPDCPTPRYHPGVGEYVTAWDKDGNVLPGWPVAVHGGTHTSPAPALADLDGDGVLEVIVNSRTAPDSHAGRVYALNGDGTAVPGWEGGKQPTTPTGNPAVFQHASTAASPVVADVTGDAGLEVLLPSGFDLVIWDQDGNQLTRQMLPPGGALVTASSGPIASAAAVADLDGDGDVEVVVGTAADGTSMIELTTGSIHAWDFDASATPAGLAWPMFRRTADNRAIVEVGRIFADGFESGDTSAW